MNESPEPSGHAAPIKVAAGLVFRSGRLLITQRPAGGHLAGLWEFPGGKREPGESMPQCLRRELAEELGITVAVGDCVEALTHTYPGKTVRLEFFRCQIIAGEPTGLDGQSLAWVTVGQLGGYTFPEADARLLDRLRAEAGWWK